MARVKKEEDIELRARKEEGSEPRTRCNARSDHHSEALTLARYLINRTKLAQQCGGLPDDLTIELSDFSIDRINIESRLKHDFHCFPSDSLFAGTRTITFVFCVNENQSARTS
jgi:hypothetical protein